MSEKRLNLILRKKLKCLLDSLMFIHFYILFKTLRLVLLAVTFHLLCIERKFVFRTVRLKRHSNTFLLTCMIIFLIEILSAISWNDVHWWFLQQNPGEKVVYYIIIISDCVLI